MFCCTRHNPGRVDKVEVVYYYGDIRLTLRSPGYLKYSAVCHKCGGLFEGTQALPADTVLSQFVANLEQAARDGKAQIAVLEQRLRERSESLETARSRVTEYVNEFVKQRDRAEELQKLLDAERRRKKTRR